jgi:hypothetical protein
MKKYVMVLKTDYLYTKEQLEEMKDELNRALMTLEVSKVLNVRPHEEVLFVELGND